ncbi:MAG: hypothetical protein R3239_05870, partial [Thermodesulfobacteriota bacterium]|nr:hypothetical protein [Thermodesulfobacteriota bacterium]
ILDGRFLPDDFRLGPEPPIRRILLRTCQEGLATYPFQISRFADTRIFFGRKTGDYPVKRVRLFSGPFPSGLSRTVIGSGNPLIFRPLRDPHDLTVMAWRMQYNKVCKKTETGSGEDSKMTGRYEC